MRLAAGACALVLATCAHVEQCAPEAKPIRKPASTCAADLKATPGCIYGVWLGASCKVNIL